MACEWLPSLGGRGKQQTELSVRPQYVVGIPPLSKTQTTVITMRHTTAQSKGKDKDMKGYTRTTIIDECDVQAYICRFKVQTGTSCFLDFKSSSEIPTDFGFRVDLWKNHVEFFKNLIVQRL